MRIKNTTNIVSENTEFDCNFGLGGGSVKLETPKELSDLLGDDADFALSCHPSCISKYGLPDYVVEQMKKVGKHTVNIDGKEVRIW